MDLKIEISECTGQSDEQAVLDTIDFAHWHFYPTQDDDLGEVLEKIVRRHVAEAFRNSLRDDPPDIQFETDGANVSVSFDFGSNFNDGHIYFTASIEELIEEYIRHSHRHEMEGGDEAKIALAKTLRGCAAKLETALASS